MNTVRKKAYLQPVLQLRDLRVCFISRKFRVFRFACCYVGFITRFLQRGGEEEEEEEEETDEEEEEQEGRIKEGGGRKTKV